MTNIQLCSIPFLSLDYSNVIDFPTIVHRDNYFISKVLKTIKTNIKYDSERSYIVLNENVGDCQQYDYLWFTDQNNKRWFYFITNKSLETVNTTRLFLSLDIWTTYLFDFELMPSFIERCHVPRWNGNTPTYNMENEDLEIGEYIQTSSPTDLYTMNDSVIISTSVPIGKVYGYENGSGGGDPGGGGSWINGKLSSKGFRFIKGFEGFAPNKYQDSGGYWTIAYGVTAHGEPTIYNQLVSESPISEERAAKVSYDLKNTNYGSKIIDSVKNLGCDKQYQFDALCSLAYNCGNGVVNGSNNLTRAIAEDPTNESVIRPIWEKFYITSGGVTLPGLIARRKEECNMFFNKQFEIRSISKIDSNGNINGTVTENNGNGWLPSDTSVGEIEGYKVFKNDFGEFMCPVKGATVTSKYGWRIHPITGIRTFHHGTDLGLAQGSPTVASVDGEITQTGYHSSMGNYIFLDKNGYRTKYMHLSQILVEQGQTVRRGEKVGLIGSTGDSTGPHCHWEIRRISDNESTDPAPNLQKGDKV